MYKVKRGVEYAICYFLYNTYHESEVARMLQCQLKFTSLAFLSLVQVIAQSAVLCWIRSKTKKSRLLRLLIIILSAYLTSKVEPSVLSIFL